MTARVGTLTMNPAVDIACLAPNVQPTHKIRTTGERIDAGGGINVATVVHSLGGDTLALVMTGGSTGRICEDLLNEAGVPCQALPIRGRPRISLNVQEQAMGLESLGTDGAFIATEDQLVQMPGIPIKTKGAAGAGDSFLAGLILAFTRDLEARDALDFAVAAGAAAVSTLGTTQVARSLVDELFAASYKQTERPQ